MKQSRNSVVNNINYGTINNVNITIDSYNNVNYDTLTTCDILRILNNGTNSPIKLLEELHFNTNRKENNNIYVTNTKDKYCKVYYDE